MYKNIHIIDEQPAMRSTSGFEHAFPNSIKLRIVSNVRVRSECDDMKTGSKYTAMCMEHGLQHKHTHTYVIYAYETVSGSERNRYLHIALMHYAHSYE